MRHLAIVMTAAFAVVLLSGSHPDYASAATHVVKVTDQGLTPPSLLIARGDVVRWEWESGNHTVRSGSGPQDPKAGEVWEFPLNGGAPVFEMVFEAVGTFEYYSAPYFNRGVKGTVEVKESTDAAPKTWSRLKTLFLDTRPVHPL